MTYGERRQDVGGKVAALDALRDAGKAGARLADQVEKDARGKAPSAGNRRCSSLYSRFVQVNRARPSVLMIMTMMRVGEMGVRVGHRRMSMRMTMWLTERYRFIVRVLVMGVVDVRVLVR